MRRWPDATSTQLAEYLRQRNGLKSASIRSLRSILYSFEQYVVAQIRGELNRQALVQWLVKETEQRPASEVIARAQAVSSYLDWLALAGCISSNPFAELRETLRGRSTAAAVRVLLSNDPTEALRSAQHPPLFASHLGPALRQHVDRMRSMGLLYCDHRFVQFDRFLQARQHASSLPLPTLVQEHAALAKTPAGYLRRISVGRILAEALRRTNVVIAPISHDPQMAAQVIRQRVKPYIFTPEEVHRLFDAARNFPSPKDPLRPLILYTMCVLAYCAGLRVGEIARLNIGDFSAKEGTIDIRETKFYKSRRLPLAPGAIEALQTYMQQRREAGFSEDPDAHLFCRPKGGYIPVSAANLLRSVIRNAGLGRSSDEARPRVHDLRHTFVVHRMTQWYRDGINPQSRLQYLATYLGHRDIHSTLVYLTITQELLRSASERFRKYGAELLGQTSTSSGDIQQ